MSAARVGRRGSIAAAVIAFPFALAGLGWLFQRAGLVRDRQRHPPAGLLLSRGGRSLHVLRMGTGRQGVVFEAGIAATSLSWSVVQPLVAGVATTVSYDRAGLGWSSAAHGEPPSLAEMLADLGAVTAWAGAPVVLVGHSFGALLALAFASRSPHRVAGLVLVDPISLETWAECCPADRRRLATGYRLSRRGAWLAEFGVVRLALLLLLHGGTRWARRIGRASAGPGTSTLERLIGEVGKLPRETWPAVVAHWSRASSFRAMAANLLRLPALAAETARLALPADLPVVVLSAATATPAELRERDRWIAGQAHARHIKVPAAGHWLHLDRPEIVAEAVTWCVQQAGTNTRP